MSSAVASRPLFTKPLRTVTCSYTPKSGGVVYLSAAVPADVDSVCAGRPLLSGNELLRLGAMARCQLGSPATRKLGVQGYFVTVYSDSGPANIRAAEELCA